METSIKPWQSSEKLSWGLTLLAAAFLLSAILSVYSLTNLGVEIDPQAAAQPNPLQMALGCLSPLSAILEIIAVILLFLDSKRVGGTHRTFSIAGLILFLVSLAGVVLTIVLSIGATMSGDLSSYLALMWLGGLNSVISMIAIFLLVFNISPQWARILLIAGLVMLVVGQIGSTYLTATNTSLQSYEMMNQTYYIPKIDMDRTTGIFPILSGAAALAVVVYLVTFIGLAITSWRGMSSELPETVS